MDIRAALKDQYHAAMAMLRQAIDECPDDLWMGGGFPYAVPFWRVAYHALFFTHLYLQSDHESFRPWQHHRDQYQFLGALPWPPHDKPADGEPYAKTQIVEYWSLCDAMIDVAVDGLDLDATECGFPWYKMPKLDHQINNIRHVQHHAAMLGGRLRLTAGTDFRWVGSGLQSSRG
jgi:hypothetical protein